MLTAVTTVDATNLILFGANIWNLFTLMKKDQGKINTGFQRIFIWISLKLKIAFLIPIKDQILDNLPQTVMDDKQLQEWWKMINYYSYRWMIDKLMYDK